jgi:hypothetical protein
MSVRLVLPIAAAILATLLLAWYVLFARRNHQRAIEIVDRLRLAWRCRILGMRWNGTSRLRAGIHIPAGSFRSAFVTLHLRPRPLVLSRFFRGKRIKESITIEADLEQPPTFQLEVHNHRWSGQSNRDGRKNREWSTHRPGPILLTSCDDWEAENQPVMHAMMVARESEFSDVMLRPRSPHLTATLRLEAVPDYQSAVNVFGSLREIAAGLRTQSPSRED